MRFLVVDALARASGSRYTSFDVVGAGPRIVAGIIHEAGYDTKLLSYELFMKESNLEQYDIVMVSIMSSDKGTLKRIINKLEEKNFKGILIVGGPASFEYNVLLQEYSRIDYVMVGEGEIPLESILKNPQILFDKDPKQLSNIPALAYRNEDTIYLTSQHIHTPAEKLSSIRPWTNIRVSYENYRVHRYYVEVLRGCSNYQRPMITGYPGLNCTRCFLCKSPDMEKRLVCPANIPPGCGFCSVPYMFGPARSRSIDSIVEEIKELIKNGARRIVLSAPDFLDYGRDWLVKPKPLTNPCDPPTNIEAIDQLLGEIYDLSSVKNGIVRVFIENIKACLVDDKVASLLGKYLKGTTVHIGLETGDNWFNEYVLGKPIFKEHVIRAVKLLSKHGLRPYVYLIYGLPFMNRKTYLETIKTVKELSSLGVEKITLYKYVKLPGTAFRNIDFGIEGFEDLVSKLKNVVYRVNVNKKKFFIGKKLRVYLVYSNGKYYGYPVDHGPVVFVKGVNKPGYSNCLALVEIYDVGPRNLWGRLIDIIEC